tara:strand:- start:1528 stop:1695 length:168 start_codon:yes stop_codon:yes gene_type:complete
MEISDLSFKKALWEKSPLKKVQPVEKTADKEKYDIVFADIDWDLYCPGTFVSKYA